MSFFHGEVAEARAGGVGGGDGQCFSLFSFSPLLR